MDIHVSEKQIANGLAIGMIVLDRPAALNALSHEMMMALSAAFHRWAKDDRVVAIVLQGAGERAFCAGGDIRAMHQLLQSHTEAEVFEIASDYFSVEYQLEYLIHTYQKPILVWGHGVVMGGGWGLFAGASHRVITENTRMGMPEVHIGLYPDAGGSWFLSRLPARLGLFLALTGTAIGPRDIMRLGIADYCMAGSQQEQVLQELHVLPWGRDAALNHDMLSNMLAAKAQECTLTLPDAELFIFRDQISQALHAGDVASAISRLFSLRGKSAWLDKALDSMAAGCPLSQVLAYELQRYAKHRSLADVFRMEWWVSIQCCLNPDFSEGVRARLIHKGDTPKWQAASITEISDKQLSRFMVIPQEIPNPLAKLGFELH